MKMKTLPICLLLSLIAGVANAGGDASGGGSSLQGRLLDAKIKANSIKFDGVDGQNLGEMEKMISAAMPELGWNFSYFYNSPNGKRFVLVNDLPTVRENNIQHEAADGLIAVQRGPNIWVKKSFWESADPSERRDFIVHEFLVAEKLKAGKLSGLDREEVVNTTAYISETLDQFKSLKGKRMSDFAAQEFQAKLEKNHFEAGLTKAEVELVTQLDLKIVRTISKACREKNPDSNGLSTLENIAKFAQRKADASSSAVAKKSYLDVVETVRDKQAERGGVCEGFRQMLSDSRVDHEIDPSGSPTLDQNFFDTLIDGAVTAK